MKRYLLIGFLPLIVLVLIILGFYIYFSNSDKQGNASSDNIEYSKEIGAFKGRYILESMNSKTDSLLKEHNFKIDTASIWIEQVWHTRVKYLLFQPVQFIDKYQIISNNIDANTTLKKQLRLACKPIKNEDYFNYSVKKEISIFDYIPQHIDIYCYLLPSDTANLLGIAKFKYTRN